MRNAYKLFSVLFLFFELSLLSGCTTPFKEYQYDNKPVTVEDKSIQPTTKIVIEAEDSTEVVTYPIK